MRTDESYWYQRYEALERKALSKGEFFLTKGWLVPRQVELNVGPDETDGYLSFTLPPANAWRRAIPDEHTLGQFLSLATGTPADILRFARRFGPILLERSQPGDAINHPIWRYDNRTLFLGELTSYWRSVSATMSALTTTAQLLRAKEPVPAELWLQINRSAVIYDWSRNLDNTRKLDPEAQDFGQRLDKEIAGWVLRTHWRPAREPWKRLEAALVSLMSSNPFNLAVRFNLGRGRLSLDFAPTLISYLQMQVLLACGQGGGLALCPCGRMFTPRRGVAEGRSAWCPKCRNQHAPTNAASRRYYANNREKILRKLRAKRHTEIEL